MNMNFDLDALRSIVTGADLGSFAQAAVQLGRSQSAISMQLKKVEQQTGTQLFARKGRGLIPTPAGEILIAYARQLLALNDEAATALGATTASTPVRIGMPQDFFEDVMPATLTAFSHEHPNMQVNIRVGENHKMYDDVKAGRLDGAIAFFEEGNTNEGKLLCRLPIQWLTHETYLNKPAAEHLALIMFDHPCLFRKVALAACEKSKKSWRMAVTTPSLPYIWSSLRSGLGIAVRCEHQIPQDIICVDKEFGLPKLPFIELRLLQSPIASESAVELCEMLESETNKLVDSSY